MNYYYWNIARLLNMASIAEVEKNYDAEGILSSTLLTSTAVGLTGHPVSCTGISEPDLPIHIKAFLWGRQTERVKETVWGGGSPPWSKLVLTNYT